MPDPMATQKWHMWCARGFCREKKKKGSNEQTAAREMRTNSVRKRRQGSHASQAATRVREEPRARSKTRTFHATFG